MATVNQIVRKSIELATDGKTKIYDAGFDNMLLVKANDRVIERIGYSSSITGIAKHVNTPFNYFWLAFDSELDSKQDIVDTVMFISSIN